MSLSTQSSEKGNLSPKLLLCMCIILTVCGLHVAHADDKLDIIHFVEEGNWPPYSPNAVGNTKVGLSYDLMKAIFSHLNINVEVELVPQKRALRYVKTGKKDAIPVITISPERQQFIVYTDEIIPENGFIYYHSNGGKHFEWETFEDLQGLQIGVVSGSSYGPKFNKAAVDLNLDLVKITRTVQLFDMLMADRIDIALCSEKTATRILRDDKYKGKISHTPNTYYDKGFHIGFSKKSKAIIPKVNKVIEKMIADGSLQAIVDKY